MTSAQTPPIHTAPRFAATALMLGNIVTGCTVLAPAGMLPELAAGLSIEVHTAGLLITFGAVVLCICSPLTAWLTSRFDRRHLLAATLLVLACGNLASAVAPDYASLLAIRLVMLAVGALYTPQAAGTAALISPVEKRGSTIAYVFLGWSLAAAVGLPLITFIGSHAGWRTAYVAVGAAGAVSLLLLAWRLPSGLKGAPVALKTWSELGRNRTVVLLLLITALQMSGQFVIFTFMGPLLAKLTGADANAVGLVFAIYGACGFVGVVIATRIVDGWGPYRTSLLFTCLLFAGIALWTIGAGVYAAMAAAVAIWGLGFASTNSMQQVRLVAAAPPLAAASVSLNTSVLYIGQAVGSAVGGSLFARGSLGATGYVAMGFVMLALLAILASRPRAPVAALA
ncbi:MFS transporter [Bradyrhizobium sp. SSBR45G]|uniref:MFS transporter n=1 Tax=unclassified Bradyrhizobium TaxID=2631580 RepID=UPI0023429097|nr:MULTISPECIES: MFS transporter [unclassified Bradyrhizobium]GLH77830.1 MFS transporter [Bradyrhizobium sp. SSBR45G]GLH85549.1 MFS transporter [Bradyrhizobium sp. SSBR45R]